MVRSFDPCIREMLDESTVLNHDVESTCNELASINHHFGGHRVLATFLRRWLRPGGHYRVLDLCAGAGDGPRFMVHWARQRNISLKVDALDANPAAVALGTSRSREFPEIRFHCGDALCDAPSTGYDLVNCSLALHHFSEADATSLLRRCSTLARRWVLVTDLERSVFTAAAIWLITAVLYRHRMTAHDGRMSARRAFSFSELRHLAAVAGWRHFGQERFLFCRQSLWLAKQPQVDADHV